MYVKQQTCLSVQRNSNPDLSLCKIRSTEPHCRHLVRNNYDNRGRSLSGTLINDQFLLYMLRTFPQYWASCAAVGSFFFSGNVCV